MLRVSWRKINNFLLSCQVHIFHSAWNSVAVAKGCVRILVSVRIVRNVDVAPMTKCWPIV